MFRKSLVIVTLITFSFSSHAGIFSGKKKVREYRSTVDALCQKFKNSSNIQKIGACSLVETKTTGCTHNYMKNGKKQYFSLPFYIVPTVTEYSDGTEVWSHQIFHGNDLFWGGRWDKRKFVFKDEKIVGMKENESVCGKI